MVAMHRPCIPAMWKGCRCHATIVNATFHAFHVGVNEHHRFHVTVEGSGIHCGTAQDCARRRNPRRCRANGASAVPVVQAKNPEGKLQDCIAVRMDRLETWQQEVLCKCGNDYNGQWRMGEKSIGVAAKMQVQDRIGAQTQHT